MAETKAAAELAFDAFIESYTPNTRRRGPTCLSRDRDTLLGFLRLPRRALEAPADHQSH